MARRVVVAAAAFVLRVAVAARPTVFLATPNGEAIALPNGSTPVDFAYAIHSEVGDRTVGAKVDGTPAVGSC